MKIVRWVLGRIVLFVEALTKPKGVVRELTLQNKFDEKTQSYRIYQFEACPFCVKVRRTVNKYSLNVEYRDAKNNSRDRSELNRKGGKIKVPCLRYLDAGGDEKWLYESEAINEHFEDLVTEIDGLVTA